MRLPIVSVVVVLIFSLPPGCGALEGWICGKGPICLVYRFILLQTIVVNGSACPISKKVIPLSG